MKSVLFVNHLRRGSASNYRQAGFAKCLRARGYETSLICAPGPEPAGDGLGDPFHKVGFWAEPFPTKFPTNLDMLAKAMRDVDIVHVNRASPYTASLLISAKRGRETSLVVDMEDLDGYGGYSSYVGSYGPKGWALTAFERIFPRRADAILVVSHLLKARMQDSGVRPDRIYLVPNGYDGELFRADIDRQAAKKTYGVSGMPTVMYSSTYWSFERPQHKTALSAFKILAELLPDVKLIMTGKLTPEISELLRSLSIEDKVVRTGFVPRSEVPVVMAAADIALHVISEHQFHAASSPMVVSEYLAMGKPVVAPMIGELTVMLARGAGVLVPRSEPRLLAEAAAKLMGDSALREKVGAAARARAESTYSYESETDTLEEAYELAIHKRVCGDAAT